MPRLLGLLTVMALFPLPGTAGNLKLSTEGWKLRYALQGFTPRHAPPVAGHLGKSDTRPRKDACVFVAGVRHCPLPELPK